jgi:SpoIIAA-like
MLEILDETSGVVLAVRVKGKHLREESHKLAALLDARIAKYGGVRCLVEIVHPEGAELGALSEGLDFDLHHTTQVERTAIVGDRAWESWLSKLLGLFFRNAQIRFFEASQRERALEWIREGT